MNWDQQYWRRYGMTSTVEERCVTPFADLLETYVGSNRLATWNRTRGLFIGLGPRGGRLYDSGGNWDSLRHVSVHQRRRLTGAGWLTLNGEAPDQLELIMRAAGCSEPQPIEWYIRTALLAIPEAQRAANIRRHERLAERNGHDSYYEHRNAWVQSLGYKSLYHYRKDKQWT
jgi:hypothetical protein